MMISFHVIINHSRLQVNIQKSTTSVSLNRTSLKKLRGWNFDQNQSSINHISGGFFSINGINVDLYYEELKIWSQPIINQPEVAILGVGRAERKQVFMGDKYQSRIMLPLSLSYDHRVIDGAEGARFCVHLKESLGKDFAYKLALAV